MEVITIIEMVIIMETITIILVMVMVITDGTITAVTTVVKN